MKKEIVITKAGRQYAEAYEKHYRDKDLNTALHSYKDIVHSYPGSKESEYCRSQILNIARDVVPKDVLYNAQLDMALDYAKRSDVSNISSTETMI